MSWITDIFLWHNSLINCALHLFSKNVKLNDESPYKGLCTSCQSLFSFIWEECGETAEHAANDVGQNIYLLNPLSTFDE